MKGMFQCSLYNPEEIICVFEISPEMFSVRYYSNVIPSFDKLNLLN